MDHAAAHERIEDLLHDPTRLAALAASTAADDVALRVHVADCPTCRADLEVWRDLQRWISVSLPATIGAAQAVVEPIELPPSLRAATIDAIRPQQPRAVVRPLRPARSRPRFATWLGLAAAIAVLAGAGLVSVDQIGQKSAAEADARALTGAIAAVDRVLAEPDHRAVALRNATGVAEGSVSWSSHDFVVLTTALVEPPAGQRYRCWLDDGAHSVPIGWMFFAGQTAYWTGSLDEWATFQIWPTTKFVVTLESAGSTDRTGQAVLSADLGLTQ